MTGLRHGYCRSRANGGPSHEYRTWMMMRTRCGVRAKPIARYARYVELGMCEDWKLSFTNFLEYVLATLGPHPGSGWTIDRIDNDVGYFPGNVRWATAKTQANNRRPPRRDGGQTIQ